MLRVYFVVKNYKISVRIGHNVLCRKARKRKNKKLYSLLSIIKKEKQKGVKL